MARSRRREIVFDAPAVRKPFRRPKPEWPGQPLENREPDSPRPEPERETPEQENARRIRRRLYRHGRANEVLFDHVLRRYAMERVLARMCAASPGDLLLRGAWAMEMRLGVRHRDWRTVQLCDRRDRGEAAIADLVRGCGAEGDDGLRFDPDSLRVQALHPGKPYGWLRLKLFAYVDTAQIPVQLEVAHPWSHVPEPEVFELETLLDQPFELPVFALDSVMAEKVQEIVVRGTAKARMKDFYDAFLLANADPMEDLETAVAAVFDQRGTALPDEVPPALSEGYAASTHARHHWGAFLERGQTLEALDFEDVVAGIRERVLPVFGVDS